MSVRAAQTISFDDGATAGWMKAFHRSAEASDIARSYDFYEDRTIGFATRRQPPHGAGVFIVNFGAPIRIRDAEGKETVCGAGQGFAAGPHLKPAFVASSGVQSGVHLHLSLLALNRLIGAPLDALQDSVVPLDALFGGKIARALGAYTDDTAQGALALDSFVCNAARRNAPQDRRLVAGVRLLETRSDLDIAAIAEIVGWSRKHFTATVRAALGVGPRTYRRLLRFEAASEALKRGVTPLAIIAAESGYADQAHMTREFREFAELSPAQMARRVSGEFRGIVEA